MILNRIESVIQKEMMSKDNAERIAAEQNQPVKFMPCPQSLNFILGLIENKMQENS
jgi:hypothetical protein